LHRGEAHGRRSDRCRRGGKNYKETSHFGLLASLTLAFAHSWIERSWCGRRLHPAIIFSRGMRETKRARAFLSPQISDLRRYPASVALGG
jgi:hypothetical protein